MKQINTRGFVSNFELNIWYHLRTLVNELHLYYFNTQIGTKLTAISSMKRNL